MVVRFEVQYASAYANVRCNLHEALTPTVLGRYAAPCLVTAYAASDVVQAESVGLALCSAYSASLASVSATTTSSTAVVTPPPVTQSVVVATQTAPTPTVSVAVTSQVPANTPSTSNTPAPSTTKSAAGVFTSTSSGASSTTSGPAQVHTNSGNGLRPSLVLLSASFLFFSALALLL